MSARSEEMNARRISDSAPLLSWATLPFYIGGFLGPFGTILVIAIYPELRDEFDATTAAVNWSFSGYLLPMAALMLVSGTIGERYGRARVTRITFISYAVASLAAVFAPTLGVFLAARVLQGMCNAFITPLLLAGLIEIIPPSRTGGAVGIYSSFQAAGSTAAPLAAGGLAVIDWRWAFVLLAVVAGLLALRPAPGAPRPGAEAPKLRPLLTWRMAVLWLAAFLGAAGPLGVAVFVGLYLRDELDVGSFAAGASLAVIGAAGAVASPLLGRVLDSVGPVRASVVAMSSCGVLIALVGLVGSPVVLTIVMVAAMVGVAFGVVILQHLAALAVPENRGGGTSSVLSFRFAGHAIGPLALVPVFTRSPGLTFVIVALLAAATMVALVAAARTSSPDA
ncbi:MAG: MFS transporter [Actinomycetota bacterium]